MEAERAAAVRGHVAVVDDNPANLKLMEEMLRMRGYAVRSFQRSPIALAAMAEEPSDLILLDINMPEMTGFEVCEQLKANPELAGIPVIFISALNSRTDKLRAFAAGGVDYISKPFHLEEVNARVDAHVSLRRAHAELKRQNEHLEETVAARSRDLAEANARLTILDRSKNEFLSLISHELRTPLNGLLGAGELMLESIPAGEEKGGLEVIFEGSRRRMLSVLDDALLLTEIDVNGEQFRSSTVCLQDALKAGIEKSEAFAARRRVTITPSNGDLGFVSGDSDLLLRAFTALLETAVKFSKGGRTVRVSCQALPDFQEVSIESRGLEVPDGALPKFFDLLSIGEAITPGGDLGLGLPMASRILSVFGGSVRVANVLDPPGILLTVTLRRAIPKRDS
jgi:DNA-binding response OmpR family regulator